MHPGLRNADFKNIVKEFSRSNQNGQVEFSGISRPRLIN